MDSCRVAFFRLLSMQMKQAPAHCLLVALILISLVRIIFIVITCVLLIGSFFHIHKIQQGK